MRGEVFSAGYVGTVSASCRTSEQHGACGPTAGCCSKALVRKRSFLAIYQDRLGTNIGETQKDYRVLSGLLQLPEASEASGTHATCVRERRRGTHPRQAVLVGRSGASVDAALGHFTTEGDGCRGAGRRGDARGTGKKTPFMRHFYAKNDHFTMTGLGQT